MKRRPGLETLGIVAVAVALGRFGSAIDSPGLQDIAVLLLLGAPFWWLSDGNRSSGPSEGPYSQDDFV